MDPNLFHLDWERVIEALVGIIVLSFLVERAGALLFESRWWIGRFEDARISKQRQYIQKPASSGDAQDDKNVIPLSPKELPGQKYPLKELLGFVLALVICKAWDFDAVSIILLSEHTRLIGVVVTAAIVAGGSKGSIALFQDVLGIMSSAVKEKKELALLDKQRAAQ